MPIKNGLMVDSLKFTPKMRMVDDAQIKVLKAAVFELLERVGVQMSYKPGLEVMAGAGCRIDGNTVRIPTYVLEKAISTAPKRLVLGDRFGKRSVVLEPGRTYYGPSIDCIFYQDPTTNERVMFESKHGAAHAALAERLDSFTWHMTIGMADDYGQEAADKVIGRWAIQNCTKPLVFCCNDVNSVKAIHEMAQIIVGGKEKFDRAPNVVHYSEPISPLVYYDPAVAKMIYCAENSIPLLNFPCTSSCGTGPATMAGTIVQAAAESISGIVLQQTISPGQSFVFGGYASVMHMKSTIFSYGQPEMTIMIAALSQLAQELELPFFATGGCTDAKFCDAQAAAEATLQTLTMAAVGANLVHDCASWIDHGTTASPAYMVMVNEILANVASLMQGLEVSDETLALDVIEKVGSGGNYLRERHTLKNYKNYRLDDKLWDRSMMTNWQEAGSKTFEDRLRERTLQLMAIEPEPVDPKIVAEFDKMQATWGPKKK
ncbi:MAG: trimethylamine methyltransferase family protein [Deltaproteobacteria bacterium]|jgi:trimethylamine--corrinoid protein Co-methyltransferase|nr:trimethylamine methyltransferase family protein [Deltaproteobacteria bacterium]